MFTKMIKKYIDDHVGEIFDAGYLYEVLFQVIPSKTYLKIIERFVDGGYLKRIAKGVYLIGKPTDNIDPVIDFYTSNYAGMTIGKRMFYELGLIDIPSEEIEILTSKITTNTKNINNYRLKYVDMFFIPETTAIIQGLECVSAIAKLEKYNSDEFLLIVERMIKSYDDLTFKLIINNMKYDFATIEAVAKILGEQNVTNNVIAIYEEATK